jgi:hypothetical protein
MQYKVVPFIANVRSGQGAEVAADQLQTLINDHAIQGWKFLRLENVEIIIRDPGTAGSKGCFGIGATPGLTPSENTTRYDMAVFVKE